MYGSKRIKVDKMMTPEEEREFVAISRKKLKRFFKLYGLQISEPAVDKVNERYKRMLREITERCRADNRTRSVLRDV
jgi:hypothetical protein